MSAEGNGQARWRPPHKELHRRVEEKTRRRIRARRNQRWNSWFGMGMFGMVGWSVVGPTLVGTAFGVWIDSAWPGPRSWTLIMMFAGLTVGLLVALHWVKEESDDERDER